MRKKIIYIIALNIFCWGSTSAQVNDLYNVVQPWSSAPVLHPMPAAFAGQSAVFLMDSRTFHYKTEGNNIIQANTVYRLIKVQDDKGIEMFNKVYVQIRPNMEVTDLKARVITAAGKVINVPSDKIKEEVQEGKLYKFFAMEGVEKGAEIEYMYTSKSAPNFFGSETFQSTAVPLAKARLLVIAPKHLKFQAKGFNGFKIMKDSLINNEWVIPCYSENIPELDEEQYGLRDPYLQRVDFKLSYNLNGNNDVELNTWTEFARLAYTNITTINEKEKNAIGKFTEKANIPASASEEQVIMMLEDYMKNNINVDENIVNEQSGNIEAVIKSRNTDEFGAVRFFVAMLEHKKIKYQIVFPSSRDQNPLDEEIANWRLVDKTLIYFPGTGKFLQPSETAFRYPFIDPYSAATRGLYLKGTTIGNVKSAVGRFDTIGIQQMEENVHNLEIHAAIDATGDSVIVDNKHILKGYSALYYRPIWKFLGKDKQQEAMKEIIQSGMASNHIKNIKVENTNLTDAWDNKPLLISGTIHTSELIERAGNKILFKIGALLGNQVQMYQDKPRKLPAQLGYPHLLDRKITFTIPAGYTIKNLNDLNYNVQFKRDESVYIGFVSSYKVEGNVLQVQVLETYRDLMYPLKEFEIFRKVINTAADFSKVVLVLEKKG